MRNKLIVFDIDDTLYNEIDYVKSGYKTLSKYFLEKYEINNAYDKLMKLFKQSHKKVFNRLLDNEKKQYTNEDILYLVDLYKNHLPNIKLKKNIIQLLMKLKKDYKLAIVSDGNYSTQLLKVKKLELDKYFDKIILTDKYGKKYCKPSRLTFDMLSKLFNVSLDNIYYIGDNPNKDFYISIYGIKTIRYYNKNGIYYNDKYLQNIKENFSINRLEDVVKIMENN